MITVKPINNSKDISKEDILQVTSKYIFSGKVSTTLYRLVMLVAKNVTVLNEILNGKRFYNARIHIED